MLNTCTTDKGALDFWDSSDVIGEGGRSHNSHSQKITKTIKRVKMGNL
jgi:hypothetical protein